MIVITNGLYYKPGDRYPGRPRDLEQNTGRVDVDCGSYEFASVEQTGSALQSLGIVPLVMTTEGAMDAWREFIEGAGAGGLTVNFNEGLTEFLSVIRLLVDSRRCPQVSSQSYTHRRTHTSSLWACIRRVVLCVSARISYMLLYIWTCTRK